MPPEDRELQERFQRIEGLLRDVEHRADPALLAGVREIVQALLDFHGAGIGRIVDGLDGSRLLDDLARDPLVGGMFALHGVHPHPLNDRVRQALDGVRPQLQAHSGNVALLGIEEGVVRLRLEGNCHGCPSSAQTLRQLIEAAIASAAPDVAGIEVDSAEAAPTAPGTTFISVEQLQSSLITTSKESMT